MLARLDRFGLGALALASAAATLAAWTAPTGYPASPPPSALPRATAEERALAERRAGELADALRALTLQLGQAPEPDRLEALLPGGLPDNPLRPGRGAVLASCLPEAAADADWVWCPTTGAVTPTGAQ